MSVRRVVPNLFEKAPAATRDFYAGLFELEVAMDLGWITTLSAPASPSAQLSILDYDAEPGRHPFVSIEVDDVDAVFDRAVAAGHTIVYALRTEPWGVRRFMLLDPSGRTVNVLAHAP